MSLESGGWVDSHLPKYTLLLHRGHMLGSPVNVVTLEARGVELGQGGPRSPISNPPPRACPTFAGTLGGPAGLPLLSSHHRDLDGASDLRGLRRRLLIDVGTGAPDIHACRG